MPVRALGRIRTAFDIGDGLLVTGHHAHAGTGLDGHVADGHAAFHGQLADGATGELQGMTVAASGADLADHGEHDVLGSDAEWQFAFDAHLHVLHLLGHQALGREHMLDFGRADAVGQRTEGAVGGGVRVTADHGHAGQRCALLRANHVDDALAHVVHLEFENAELVAVLVQGLHLNTRNLIGNGFQAALALAPGGRDVVVGGGDVGVDAPRLAPGQTQPLERLRRSHFMEDVTIDIDQRRTIVTPLHFVHFPELVVERFAGHRTFLICFFMRGK